MTESTVVVQPADRTAMLLCRLPLNCYRVYVHYGCENIYSRRGTLSYLITSFDMNETVTKFLSGAKFLSYSLKKSLKVSPLIKEEIPECVVQSGKGSLCLSGQKYLNSLRLTHDGVYCASNVIPLKGLTRGAAVVASLLQKK